MRGVFSKAIDAAFDAEKPDKYRSSRIGASIIGNPCEAYIAFNLRGFPSMPITPKLKRIFREGKRLEYPIVADMKKAGFLLQEKDPMTNTQYMWTSHGGHVVFYADGIIGEKNAMLFEAKSMNDAEFKKFQKRPVAISHPKYYAQLQFGMGMSKFRQALIVSYNKNTSLYWDEVVDFDEAKFYYLKSRAERVLYGLAEKVASDPSDWRCKDCPKRGVCWEGQEVVEDMRSCAHAAPSMKGGWACSKGCTDKCLDWKRYEPRARP